MVRSISDSSTIAHGFVDNNGVYTTVDEPNANPSTYGIYGYAGTYLTGINASAEMVGYYVNSNGIYVGFTDVNGVFTNVYVPGSSGSPNFPGGTELLGVNNSGTILGEYQSGFLSATTYFTYRNGTFTALMAPPNGRGIDAFGINNSGAIVGYYGDLNNGNQYGFIATPVPEPATWCLALIGLAMLAAFRRRRT